MSKQLTELNKEIWKCKVCPRFQFLSMPGFFPKNMDILVIGQNPGQLSKRASGWDDTSYSESEEWTQFQQGYARGLFEAPLGKWLQEGLPNTTWGLTNIVKCRTPDNSVPLEKEIENCRYWLEAQLVEANPKGIITLGNPAYEWFKPKMSISNARGRMLSVHRDFWEGMLLSLWHPAYLKYQHTSRTKTPLENFVTLMRFPKLYDKALRLNSI